MNTRTSLVTRVDFVTVPTKDFQAANEFYGNVLGLERSAEYGRIDGAEFETGNLTLSVIDTGALPIGYHPNKNPIALQVDNVEAARKELESRGVVFTGETLDSGVCHMAFFADRDGNALMLHKRYAPRE
jgi:catechol 2,3-dioxygenase-like lactoylglutathione lyase family enzyme